MCYLSDPVESAPLSVTADAFIVPIEMPVSNGFYFLCECAAWLPKPLSERACFPISLLSSAPPLSPSLPFPRPALQDPFFSPLASKPPTWVCGHRGSVNYSTKSTCLTTVSSLRSH